MLVCKATLFSLLLDQKSFQDTALTMVWQIGQLVKFKYTHFEICCILTSYTAYATGLLCARRALKKVGLDEKYAGVAEPDGTLKLTEALEDDDAPRPFKAYLDAGLKRTTTGSRMFGAMKGASDGGLFVPHSDKRFPGYDTESKQLDPEILKKYIYGGHVAEYMESLEEEDDERWDMLLIDNEFWI